MLLCIIPENFLKMYFHGFTVFPCILFLGLILGFPKQVQSLINNKFVDIKTKGWSRPSVCDLLSLRHLCRLSGTTLPPQTLFQQHGANVRISSPFKAKLFLVTRFSVYTELGSRPYLPLLPPPLLSFRKDSFALALFCH